LKWDQRVPAGRYWQKASGAVALLEFLAAAARARIVATHILQRVAYRLLVSVTAVRAVDMTMVVIVVLMLVIVIAIRAVDMGLLGHAGVTPE